jgi:hypothetical protein
LPNNVLISVSSGGTLNVLASIPNDAISGQGTINFPPSTSGGIHLVSIPGLALDPGQQITVAPAAIRSNRTLLQPASLTFGGGNNAWVGLIDLTSNDMDIQSGSLFKITNQIKEGYNGGAWNGDAGITSSAAASDTTHLTALGVIQNDQGGPALYTEFDANPVGTGDILVKFTYYGDTDLNGQVDGTDYSRIDNAYLQDRNNPGMYTGWYNGDFNYDGVIDGSDYTLMDDAFNEQGVSLADEIAKPTVLVGGQITSSSAVPEPEFGFILLAFPIALGRNRDRRRQR